MTIIPVKIEKRLTEMVKDLIEEYEAIEQFREANNIAKDKKVAIIESEYDGMASDGKSQPLTDWDYESKQP